MTIVIRKYGLSAAFCLIWSASVTAKLDVALLEFVLTGSKITTSEARVGAVLDLGQEYLTSTYGEIFNFSRVRIRDANVTTCEVMDQKATFWATRYYYRESQGNPVMAIFGPGCPTAAASVGHLARAWNKTMMIPITGDPTAAIKKRYPTLTRVSPYVQDDLTGVVYQILARFDFTTVRFWCDEYADTLQIYTSMCNALSDDLRLKYNLSQVTRFFVQGQINATTLDLVVTASSCRGNLR